MSAEHSHLLVEKSDGIMTLTMNRPEAGNSLSPQMLVKMAEAWYEFRDTRELRVAILTGAGDKDFCAGGDLKLTMPLVTGARQPEDEWDHKLVSNYTLFTDAILRGFALYKPVIAAVNGSAFGGGTEMTNACDLRVAAEHAVFGTPEAKRGLSARRWLDQPAAASNPLREGHGNPPRRRLLSAPAKRSQIGLLNYVVPKEALMKKALELAGKLAENGPFAVRKIKEGVLRTSGLPLDQALAIENEVSVAVMMSKDAREGPRAFKEKRKPRFTGE